MKTKIVIPVLLFVLAVSQLRSQTITFGFVKNCMTFNRSATTDDLSKKQFFVIERSAKNTANPMMEGAFLYSNEKERDANKGEIDVLSLINDKKQIVEITFTTGSKNDYSKNYNDLVKQMTSFFNNEKAFKSARYKGEVLKFTKDKVYYYVFTDNKIPKIVIANYKIDEEYF
jgi:hypothetical protein